MSEWTDGYAEALRSVEKRAIEREQGAAARAGRDLAEAIHHEIISPSSVEAAVELWQQYPDLDDRSRMWRVLARTSAAALDAVLARRQREAARTGPWDDSPTCRAMSGSTEEEDGYPGSLLPPKRGTP